MAISKGNRVINQHKNKCESQRASLAAYKEALFSCSRRAKEPKDQAQYFYERSRAPGKPGFSPGRSQCGVNTLIQEWNLKHGMGTTGSPQSPDYPEPSGPAEVAHVSQLKASALPMLGDGTEAAAFARQHGFLHPTFMSTADPSPTIRIKSQYNLAREVLGLLREKV